LQTKQLKLAAFMRPVSIHAGSWRYPGSRTDANFNFPLLKRFAQTLERAKFHAFFLSDHLALQDMSIDALKRGLTATSFEPFTLLSALSSVTERIGLVCTASTTFDAPYHVARRFASLDHLSQGRAGWNVVTTANPDAALNFGLTEHVEHDERYRRAREFFDVVTGLWDSWADDAFVRDAENGLYFDPAKLHVLNHSGETLKVRGPLNIARPVQGWPVIVQAGGSRVGRDFAASIADVMFGVPSNFAEAKEFRTDMGQRFRSLGRNPDELIYLPAALVVVGATDSEAQAKLARLDGLVHFESALASLSSALGVDAARFDLNGLLPDIALTNGSQSYQAYVIALARRENLSVRDLARRVGGYSGLTFVGSPSTIADQMEDWLHQEASDGFNVTFPFLPQGLDDFVELIVPELQRRRAFHSDYEGHTLRQTLGLRRPANRFFT
jgi:FMN-dependent oxidoreductase (nitrilotriacetate monooxygenase family)